MANTSHYKQLHTHGTGFIEWRRNFTFKNLKRRISSEKSLMHIMSKLLG